MSAKRRLLAAFYAVAASAAAFSQEAAPEAAAATSSSNGMKYIAAAIAMGVSALASGYAVAKIGSAAMSTIAEKPELSGKSLPYLAIAEGICLWGFLVALLIIFY
ncbi:MAG: ATP synthase subunit C [Spirochaetaceae bacterium]|nr:ATP synthase subunit C [Spirochaetaceae bacterium]